MYLNLYHNVGYYAERGLERDPTEPTEDLFPMLNGVGIVLFVSSPALVLSSDQKFGISYHITYL
jgi:hypothetical protein